MSPLPKHGHDAHLIANIITTLLDHVKREYDAFTPVTMELPEESSNILIAGYRIPPTNPKFVFSQHQHPGRSC